MKVINILTVPPQELSFTNADMAVQCLFRSGFPVFGSEQNFLTHISAMLLANEWGISAMIIKSIVQKPDSATTTLAHQNEYVALM